LSVEIHTNAVALSFKRRRRGIGLFLVLLAMGTFAYLVFASVARFFLGVAGFFLVTGVVVALLLPPYLHVHRKHKEARKHAVLYEPRPEKMPGHVAPSRLEAEVLASFILGASAVVFLVVGAAAQAWSQLGDFSDLGLEAFGLVLVWVAMAVVRTWFWTHWTAYDPYDPDGSFP